MRRRALAAGLLLGAFGCAAGPPEPLPLDAEAHQAFVEGWHARRVAELEAPDSWLSLIGLHWLPEGETTLGSDPGSDVVLPAEKAPARLGTVTLADSSVVFHAAPGARITQGVDSTINLTAGTGASPPDPGADPVVAESELTADVGPGRYVVLRHGPLNWIVIRRGDRYALRIRDNEKATYDAFEGIDRYPIDASWRVTARWVPQEKPIAVPDVLGTVSESISPAYLEFWIDGARHTLDVVGDPDDERYMMVFADETSGRETYGGGRYLWIDRPDEQGRVALDFNLAYNPPCVWSEFATCPLPTRDNRLPLRVTAGERDWKH